MDGSAWDNRIVGHGGMSKAGSNKPRRYALSAEAEAWLADQAVATESSVPDVILRLVKKERDRRGGSITRPKSVSLDDFHAVSTMTRRETGG